MAGPLAGIGVAQQQIPLANASQPSQGQQAIRQQQEREPEENRIQPQGSAAAGTQDTDTGDQNTLQARASEFISTANDRGDDVEARRGSVLDISV